MAAPAITVPNGCPLTANQFVVLLRTVEGRTYKQIAHELGVAVSTIRTHIHTGYRRLGVASKAEAVAFFGQRGWWGGWNPPAPVEEPESSLADEHPFLAAYLREFDTWLASGQNDKRARNGMRIALWGARNGR